MQSQIIHESFNADQKRFLKDLISDVFGDPIELESDVTTAGGELKTNEVGFNPTNGKLFINLFGTTYLIATLTAV